MGQSDLGAMDGYLLLADISGYTAFLTGTELEHSHAIVTELTKLIRALQSPVSSKTWLRLRNGGVNLNGSESLPRKPTWM